MEIKLETSRAYYNFELRSIKCINITFLLANFECYTKYKYMIAVTILI